MEFHVRIEGVDGTAEEFIEAIRAKLATIELEGAVATPDVTVTPLTAPPKPSKKTKKSTDIDEDELLAELVEAPAVMPTEYANAFFTARFADQWTGPYPQRQYRVGPATSPRPTPEAPNRGAPWTEDLRDQLRVLWRDHVRPEAIARLMGRTTGAIEAQAHALGIMSNRQREEYTRRFR